MHVVKVIFDNTAWCANRLRLLLGGGGGGGGEYLKR